MDRAEILLEANPDSAYILLNEVKTPDRLNERQFARWCMLYCRAADKLFKDMLYTEQLDRALAWYKNHGTAEQRAWMGLYLGRSYVKDKLFIPATMAYSDALGLAKEKHLYDVAGYICSYMADLYTYTGQRSEERRKFEEAAEFFKQAGNERSYAFALRDVAKTWAFDDSLSLALHYMLIADSVITRFQDLRGISSISNGLGNIYDLMGDVEKARAYYSRSLSSDTMDQVPSYLALSDLYYNESLLDSARPAGATFNAVADEKLARELVEQRKAEEKAKANAPVTKVSLEDLFSQIQAGEMKNLNLIVKADVQGSVEAVKSSLEKLSNDEVRVRVIHGGVGAINESDVMLASTSQAIIVGFNVRPDNAARDSAARAHVDMRMYRVIYDAINEIESAMKGMLAPKFREALLGHAEVRQTYKVSGVGTVAGCYVQDGKLQRKDCQVRLVRDGIVIHEGVLASLQRFKDSVKEVAAGYECGLSIEKFNDIKEGDIVEAFTMEEIPQ